MANALSLSRGDWTAVPTSNAGDSLLRARARTGAVPPPGYAPTRVSPKRAAAPAQGLPSKVDWRAVNGQNYVTAVRDQGACGSCVAFGTLGVVESMARIESKKPKLPIDLSESDLFNCYGAKHGAGACPEGGWWPDDAWSGVKAGIVDEATCPYRELDQICRRGADAASRRTSVSKPITIDNGDIAAMKRHIATVGPLSACFEVFEDFYSFYGSGVYSYKPKTAGEFIGWHCVQVVGYDDTRSCWIAKNSWGTGWGEKGFFRIAYADQELGFDAQMWGGTGVDSYLLKMPTLHVLGLGAGAIWHTIRNTKGAWQKSFGKLPRPSGTGSAAFTQVASGGVGSTLHVLGIMNSTIWHTTRKANGSWQQNFGRVPGGSGFATVACAGVGDSLHLVGVTGGKIRHTIRRADATWQPSWGTVPGVPAQSVDDTTEISCAGIGGELHIVARFKDGRLWHTVRRSNGSWPAAWDVLKSASSTAPSAFSGVSCAATLQGLQVVGLSGGRPWHTVRRPDGTWQASFGSVQNQLQNDPGLFSAVRAAGGFSTLQLVGLSNGVAWHTLRSADGVWQPKYGRVPSTSAVPGGQFQSIAVAAT